MKSQDARMQRNRKIIVIFLGLLMILSVFGVTFFGFTNDTKVKYRGHTFYVVNNWWMTKVNGEPAYFSSTPDTVLDIPFDESAKQLLASPIQIDTTYDFHDPYNQTFALIQYQISKQLTTTSTFARHGITTNETTTLPVISCAPQPTGNVPVLYFFRGNETSITAENTCIKVSGTSEFELIRASDRIAYHLLGIIT